ncbi:MAG: TetR family transcriptional regulator [Candidatus Binatia bacterium]
MAPAARRSEASGDTRASLLAAAERLFATHGIQGVSLRTINAAAGARNASAAHYHFGSKTELLRALLDSYMEALSRDRLARLAAVRARAGSRRPALREAVEAFVVPVLRLLADPSGAGARYAMILVRAGTDPSVRLETLVPASFYESLGQMHALCCAALPHLPPELVLRRLTFGFDLTVSAVVTLDRLAGGAPALAPTDVAAFGAQLIDYVVAGLAAPVGDAARVAAQMSAPADAAGPSASPRPPARLRKDRHMRSIAFALLTLLAAGQAAAVDCLTGDPLADQRALAGTRADADGACPCAAFDGSPGRRRGDYRRCTAAVIDAALNAGALRAECKRTAQEALKVATCGTTRATCGRYRAADAVRPIDCKVQSASGCSDRPGVRERICAAETHCSDVRDWTAATCLDPRAAGPYGVGVQTLHYVKDSVTAPGTPRALDTVVWYPTTPGAGPVDPSLAGVVGAPLVTGGAPYPLLLFSHGSCSYPAQSTFLTALLASYGYVVAAPPHPGNMLSDGSACGTPTALVRSAVERPQDVIYVTDQLLLPASPFATAIDASRIGMAGHSFGGFTTFKVVGLDARFTVALPMAAVVPLTNGQPPVLPVPSMIMLGQIDSVLSTWALTDLDDLRAAYAVATPPKTLVEIPHAGHYAFSNGCFPGSDCNPPETPTQDEAHAVVLRWAVPFLERYLRGDAGAAAFFAAPPPGAVVAHAE